MFQGVVSIKDGSDCEPLIMNIKCFQFRNVRENTDLCKSLSSWRKKIKGTSTYQYFSLLCWFIRIYSFKIAQNREDINIHEFGKMSYIMGENGYFWMQDDLRS